MRTQTIGILTADVIVLQQIRSFRSNDFALDLTRAKERRHV